MKRNATIAAGVVLLIVGFIAFNQRHARGPSVENAVAPLEPTSQQTVHNGNLPTSTSGQKLAEVTPTATPVSQVSKSSESATGVWVELKNRQFGKIVNGSGGLRNLVVNGEVIFEAKKFGYRSESKNGLIALSAVTGEHPPLSQGEGSDKNEGKWSPGQVWILEKGKAPLLITPASRDSWNPVISDDGRRVAYTGRTIDTKDILGEPQLYVIDLVTGKTAVVPGLGHKHDARITALSWDGSQKLKYVTDYGETGGHAQIMHLVLE